jgi:hypothetical protein
MKNKLILLAILLSLACCDKDDNKPKTELEKLPPATQTGANTAGCLVNGVAFLPKGYLPSGNLVCNYSDGKNFSISFAQRLNNQTILVGVISYNQSLVVNEIYQLKEYGSNSQFGEYNIYQNIGDIQYKTTPTITGELKITNHNFNKATLSGTFWFDAVNSAGEIVQVRDGRFDMEY